MADDNDFRAMARHMLFKKNCWEGKKIWFSNKSWDYRRHSTLKIRIKLLMECLSNPF